MNGPRILVTCSVLTALALWGGCATHGGTAESLAAQPAVPAASDAITFWGHASMLIDIGGVGLVTDPMFEPSYAPTSRRIIGRPGPAALQRVQLILLSHAHVDHLNRNSLETFPKNTLILCPPPCAKYLEGLNHQVMAPWESFSMGEIMVTAVPAHHPGGRFALLGAAADGRALGYVIQAPQATIYYSGDTNYFEGMEEIGQRFAPDIAILNVNLHLRGGDAVRAAKALGAEVVIPSHHGAFAHPMGPSGARWRRRLQQSLGDTYQEIPIGRSWPLDAVRQ